MTNKRLRKANDKPTERKKKTAGKKSDKVACLSLLGFSVGRQKDVWWRQGPEEGPNSMMVGDVHHNWNLLVLQQRVTGIKGFH